MSSVLQNAKTHMQDVLSGGLQKISVPEWNTDIYFKAASTFAQEQKIIELHGKGKLVEALVETLVSKSLDAEGKKLFTAADKVVLMREVDPEVIIKVVGEMNEAKEAAKDALGN
jgi:hypothetical protein